ncbi:hypothetical protein [Granulicella arctica]|uniref:Uncharacterized protein n=1 Tax=Granulicella arctica TaxID=940613 RepID=A0A7Y9PG10_9BACT|nr:hypothetical protein [Granulicella arctica]NYF79034.1 hypothetical protein [Granulicella arctica]
MGISSPSQLAPAILNGMLIEPDQQNNEARGAELSSLLEQVLEAHGGLQQWQKLSDLVAEIQMEGHLCPPPAPSSAIPQSQAFFSLRQQRIVIVTDDGNRRILIEPHLVSFLGDQSTQLKVFPISERASWAACAEGSLDLLRTAYVLGFVIRHHVTAPFLYTGPGFIVEEIDPWHEDGETWRVLRIGFPLDIETPARVQYAYYGDDGLLRRTRYRLGSAEGTECVDYVSSYQQVSGIWLPVAHEVLACDSDGRRLPNKLLARIRLLHPFFSE